MSFQVAKYGYQCSLSLFFFFFIFWWIVGCWWLFSSTNWFYMMTMWVDKLFQYNNWLILLNHKLWGFFFFFKLSGICLQRVKKLCLICLVGAAIQIVDPMYLPRVRTIVMLDCFSSLWMMNEFTYQKNKWMNLIFLDCIDFVFLLCFMAFYGYYVLLPEDKCEMRSSTIYHTNIYIYIFYI